MIMLCVDESLDPAEIFIVSVGMQVKEGQGIGPS